MNKFMIFNDGVKTLSISIDVKLIKTYRYKDLYVVEVREKCAPIDHVVSEKMWEIVNNYKVFRNPS